MTRALRLLSASPGITIQDTGRPGYLARGLSRGGAADPLALAEGAALLGQPDSHGALEMPGMGGTFEVTEPTRIAVTGAPMQAGIDGARLAWNASHLLLPGQRLSIGAALSGNYGYLHLGGGIATDAFLGARSAHLVAGIGAPLAAGTDLPLGPDAGHATGMTLPPDDRFAGGSIRIIPSAQTALFAPADRERLTATQFTRNPRSNRMGVRLAHDGEPYAAEDQHTILSEMVVPGDIQVAGDGTPFVLLYEHQTTGGYPRIATVIPPDLPRIAQARAGDPIRFQWVTRDQALAAHRAAETHRLSLRRHVRPLVRSPHDIGDLLSYQLISGMITGTEE